jgi:hypothetical protein
MKKTTDFDLALAIVNREIMSLCNDMRVHGADETYATCMRVLTKMRNEILSLKVELGA